MSVAVFSTYTSSDGAVVNECIDGALRCHRHHGSKPCNDIMQVMLDGVDAFTRTTPFTAKVPIARATDQQAAIAVGVPGHDTSLRPISIRDAYGKVVHLGFSGPGQGRWHLRTLLINHLAGLHGSIRCEGGTNSCIASKEHFNSLNVNSIAYIVEAFSVFDTECCTKCVEVLAVTRFGPPF